MTYNRRVKRLRADWDGTCHIDGEVAELRCKVVDISMLGLGVTFKHPSPTELAGRRISVNVPAVAQLNGAITHAELMLGGTVRVGITLTEPSASEAGSASAGTMVEQNRT
jgi:hypothetical protein